MLLSNFLCLFYLMVLINAYTISKSIINDENIDDIIDNINDLDYTTEYSVHHDRFRHKFRREDGKIKEGTKIKKQVDENTTESLKHKAAVLLSNATVNMLNSMEKATVASASGVWSMIKDKLKNTPPETRRRLEKTRSKSKTEINKSTRRLAAVQYVHFADYKPFKNGKKKKHLFNIGKRQTRENLTSEFDRVATKIDPSKLDAKTQDKSYSKYMYNTMQPILSEDNDDNATIAYLSTQLHDKPKLDYWSDDKTTAEHVNEENPYLTTSDNKINTFDDKVSEKVPTERNKEFTGIEVIEALLNEIKINAIKMISEQNPGVSDMINNAVTETTFEADPLLHHVTQPRIVEKNEFDDDRANNALAVTPPSVEQKRNLPRRSVLQIYTTAEDLDKFSKFRTHVRNVLKNAKCSVCKQVRNGMNEVKSVTRKILRKLEHVSNSLERPCHSKHCKPCNSPKPYITEVFTSRCPRATFTEALEKQLKAQYSSRRNFSQSGQFTLPSLGDDYASIKLFEEVLAKTHEDNLMKMLTTQSNVPEQITPSLKDNVKVSIRNSETLEDLKLNDHVRRVHGTEGIPGDDITANEVENFANKAIKKVKREEVQEEPITTTEMDQTTEDTSFEGLTNKMSFNEYVDGYKHYLNFAKELNDQNFSANIRFQAHKHHNVDDIGKYILEKLPPMPSDNSTERSKRNFFDDSDAEDLDISTMSDDSWFKKHLYPFIEAAKKKYRTSQTVFTRPALEQSLPSKTNIDKRKDLMGKERDFSKTTGTIKSLSKSVSYDTPELNIDHNMKEIDDLLNSLNKSSSVIGIPNGTNPYEVDPQDMPITIPCNRLHHKMPTTKLSQHFINKLLYRSGRKTFKKTKNLENETQTEPNKVDRVKRSSKSDGKRNTASYGQKEDNSLKPVNVVDRHVTSAPKNKKFGYVTMNLISKSTATVKLKKDNGKSRLSRLLDKLNFHKKDERKKIRRHIRGESYNPFKRFKEIFQKTKKPHFDTDFDLMSTKLNSFKVFKYDKVLSPHEMYVQVPNISMDDKNLEPYHILPSTDPYDYNFNVNSQAMPFTAKITSTNKNLMEKPETSTSLVLDDLLKSVKAMQKHVNFKNYPYVEKINYKNNYGDSDISKFKFKTHKDDLRAKEDTKKLYNSQLPIYNVSYNVKRPEAYVHKESNTRYKNKNHEDEKNRDETRAIDMYPFKKRYTGIAGYTIRMDRDTVKVNSKKEETDHTTLDNKQKPNYFNDLTDWHNEISILDHLTTKLNKAWATNSNLSQDSNSVKQADLMKTFYKNDNAAGKEDGARKEAYHKVLSVSGRQIGPMTHRLHPKSFKTTMESTTPIAPEEVMPRKAMRQRITPSPCDSTNRIIGPLKKKKSYISAKRVEQEPVPIVRISPPPEQYFTTPLPMATTEFDKFLKDNHLDVDTVTSPMTEMSKFEAEWTKSHMKSKLMGTTDISEPVERIKLIETTYKFSPASKFGTDKKEKQDDSKASQKETADEIEYLNQLERSLFADKNDWRQKRLDSDLTDYASVRGDRFGLFEKRLPHKFTRNHEDVTMPENLDVTVINFDELKTVIETTKFAPLQNPAEEIHVLKQYLIPKEDKVKEKPPIHNKLLYKSEQPLTAKTHKAAGRHRQNHKLAPHLPADFAKTFPRIHFGAPRKRVRVSGHTYKYDIFYDDLPRATRRHAALRMGTQNTANSFQSKKRRFDSDSTLSYKEKLKQIINIADIIEAVENYSLPNNPIYIDLPTYYFPETSKCNSDVSGQRTKKSLEPQVARKAMDKLKELLSKGGTTPVVAVTATTPWARYLDLATSAVNEIAIETAVNKKQKRDMDELEDIEKQFTKRIFPKTDKPHEIEDVTVEDPYLKTSAHEYTDAQLTTPKDNEYIEQSELSYDEQSEPSDIGKSEYADEPVIERNEYNKENSAHTGEHIEQSEHRKGHNEHNNIYIEPHYGSLLEYISNQIGDHIYNTTDNIFFSDYEDNYGNEIAEDQPVKTNTTKDIGFDEKAIEKHLDDMETEARDIKAKASQSRPHPMAFDKLKRSKVVKRDLQLPDPMYTAKNVAALEIIVDLMKDHDEIGNANSLRVRSTPENQSEKENLAAESTNSVKVHIAMPEMSGGRKRSPKSKIRKVFSARMSSPVDLEYQIKSYEISLTTESTTVAQNYLSPGMYVLVENNKCPFHQGFALKPVKSNIIREATRKTEEFVASTVRATSPKSPIPITLTKEFIKTLNEQLVKLYENLNSSIVDRKVKRSATEEPEKKKSLKDKMKEYFGHDRVCSCHCKANQTMCAACAASDSVMRELLFEFENIAKYMSDHCTEVQTYFWMNPSGGRKLRDLVRKIDKNLNSYFKRVRGKCQGRPCSTFQTYIDKRDYKPNQIDSNFIGQPMLDRFEKLANDVKRVTDLKLCCPGTFGDAASNFIKATKSCLRRNAKRSSEDKLHKNVYSLDNINVNIICSKDVPTSSPISNLGTRVYEYTTHPSILASFYNYDEITTSTISAFKKLFSKKKKAGKSNLKREVFDQVESPLIADPGGSFWSDFLSKTGKDAYKLKDKIPVKFNVLQICKPTISNMTPALYNTSEESIIDKLSTVSQQESDQTTPGLESIPTESFSDNMSQFVKIFEDLSDIQDVKDMTIGAAEETKFRATTILTKRKAKNEKESNLGKKSTKAEMVLNTKKPADTDAKKTTTKTSLVTKKLTTKCGNEKTTNKNVTQTKTDHINNFTNNKLTTSAIKKEKIDKNSTVKTRWYDRIQSLLSQAPKIIVKDNTSTILPKTNKTKNSILIENNAYIDVNSEPTTTSYPTIFIIENAETGEENASEEKNDLLYSILNLERAKLDDEIKNYVKKHVDSDTSRLTDTFLFWDSGSKTKPVQQRKSLINLLQNLKFGSGSKNKSENQALTSRQHQRDVNGRWIMGATITTLMAQEGRATLNTKTLPLEWLAGVTGENVKIPSIATSTTSKFRSLALTTQVPMQSFSKRITKPFTRTSTRQTKDTTKKDQDLKTQTVTKRKTTKTKLKMRPVSEACDPKTEQCLCDLQETADHVVRLRHTMPGDAFARYVRNVTCYRYKKAPKYFIIEMWKRKARRKNNIKSYSYETDKSTTKRRLKWDWIRNKRSLLSTDDDAGESDEGNNRDELERDEHSHSSDDDYESIDDDNGFDEDNNEKNDDFDKVETYNGINELIDNNRKTGDNMNLVLEANSDKEENDYFETYYKGDDNVYRQRKKRRKRMTGDFNVLVRGLRNLEALKPAPNEIYVMLGESTTIECLPPAKGFRERRKNVLWETDRSGMLTYDNIAVRDKDSTVFLSRAQPSNVGNYTCSEGDKVLRTVRLSVVTLPQFKIVFIPMYDSKNGCSYDDLKAVQKLSAAMSEQSFVCRRGSVRIADPVCLEDKDAETVHLRALGILTACPPPRVQCTTQCLRDLQCSLALLCAANVPALSTVNVVLSKNGINNTLTPSSSVNRKLIVTHRLGKKDAEFNQLAASMYPGDLDVVVSCPAGYYLLHRQKICVACPANTFAEAGDNACSACGAGGGAEPGAARCRPALRRYSEWWWYPPCGYMVGTMAVAGGCGVCALCALLAHVTSRSSTAHAPADAYPAHAKCPPSSSTVAHADSKLTWSRHRVTSAAKKCSSTSAAGGRSRPISPSAVILARFFTISQSSSRATDSQETKFEQWKEKNIPPPLPPIDFDLASDI